MTHDDSTHRLFLLVLIFIGRLIKFIKEEKRDAARHERTLAQGTSADVPPQAKKEAI